MLALKQDVQDSFNIDDLSDLLKARFLKGRLSLRQARAFATISHPRAQDAVYMQLGPLAKNRAILDAIQRGDTVLPLEDDFLILPSRRAR